jgi:diguanylate cyclase (GGDEF)-like protein/PAS domain S-box-containing protein
MTAATLIVLGAGPLAAQGAPGDMPPANSPAHPAMMMHGKHHGAMARLTVGGQGLSSAQPDLATISLGVSSRAATAAEAMTQNAEAQNKVIEALKAEGIEARDIQTSGLNLSPMLDYSKDGEAPRVTGYAANDIIGRHLDELLVPESPGEANDQSQQGGETSRAEPPTVEVQLRCKDGSHLWMEILSTPERDAAGRIVGYRRIGRNITERREMQDRVRELAFHDPLTGLPNRRLLGDRLGLAMAQSKRSGTYGAVLFLDLDNFKPLNDQHGHAAGDQLLIEVARRLHGCVREIDTVARFGGDEFVVVLGALHATRDESLALARNVAEKVGTVLARPYHLNVRQHDGTELAVEHTCTSSIGATLYFDNEARQEEILKRADSAMYRAKKEGRNRICFAGVDAGEAALAV